LSLVELVQLIERVDRVCRHSVWSRRDCQLYTQTAAVSWCWSSTSIMVKCLVELLDGTDVELDLSVSWVTSFSRLKVKLKTRMWANAQRDGRPAG